jgi:hypothetical protein
MLSDGPRSRRAAARRKETEAEELPTTTATSPQKDETRHRRKRRRMHRHELIGYWAIVVLVLAISCWIGWSLWAAMVRRTAPTVSTPNSSPTFVEYPSNDEGPAILIIGGTDGSGTRAFCLALKNLGVDMVVDDIHTMDVEATQLFQKTGWPGLVKFVLNETQGSLAYTWDDLSSDTQTVLQHEVKSFSKHLNLAHQIHKHKKVKGLEAFANGISFAIKAPASMLVFPVLKHVFQKELKSPVKFLHIVRDGRDMSLSQNQSPVEKFYNFTYPKDYEERSARWQGELYNVRAMQLWNDWNLQVLKISREDATYMMARSEDLLNKPWEVMQGMHSFVGSTMSMEKLCCRSQQKPSDMGESVKFVEAVGGTRGRPPKSDEQLKRSLALLKKLEGNSLSNWTKEAEEVIQIQEKQELDPRAAMEAHLSEKVDILLAQGRSLDMKNVQSDGDDILSLMEKLNDMAVQEFEKDFNGWKKSINTRDRSDTDHQNPFLVNTGKALMDRLYVLQSSISGLQKNMRLSQLPPFQQTKRIRELGKEIARSIAQINNNAGEIGDSTSKASIEKRYGKWKELLENRTLLSKHLHEEGALGLKEFGYEPFREFVYPSLGFKCSQEQLLQCSAKVSSNPKPALSKQLRSHSYMTPLAHAHITRVQELIAGSTK